MKRLGAVPGVLCVVLGLALLASCYFPPYREELSLAVPTAKKLEGTAVVGPIDRRSWDFQGRDIVFYPSKDALRIRTHDFVRGFIVATDERSARLLFVDHDPSESGEYFVGTENTFPLENADDKAFVFRVSPLKDGSDNDMNERLGIIVFDNRSQMREYLLLDQFLSVNATTDLNAGLLALGACFSANSLPAMNTFYTLRIDPTGLYLEEEYDANTGTPAAWSRPPLDLPGLPEDMTNGFYSLLPQTAPLTNRAYLSVYDGARRRYRNFSWDDAMQLQILADMDRRIDLVLSNGWLFSRDDNKGYVYAGDGRLINSFVMGGLTLVYEIFDGADYRAVFTIPAWAPVRVDENYWEEKLFFLVYWIPTDQLGDL